MKGRDAHEALYLKCEFRGPWVKNLGKGKYGVGGGG